MNYKFSLAGNPNKPDIEGSFDIYNRDWENSWTGGNEYTHTLNLKLIAKQSYSVIVEHIDDCVNNTIMGNDAFGNVEAGIYLEGNAANNTITGNTFANNFDGMWLGTSAKNNTFSRNNATDNTNYGINLTAGADGNWF